MKTSTNPYLVGQFLIAMPRLSSKPFARSLVYLCAHNADGAMGLIINQHAGRMTYGELLKQLEIPADPPVLERKVIFGGPVEPRRGFLLHSTDHTEESSLLVTEETALTSTVDILRAVAKGEGPRYSLLALGYAGWAPGQLDEEIQQNAWLSVDADEALLFDADLDTKWHRAIAKLGVDVSMLSAEAGHA
jgi:putative transcriptional regulator